MSTTPTAALSAGENVAQNVLESITDGFAAVDSDWRFVYINEPGLKILSPLRKTRENLLGRSIWTEMPQVVGTMIEEHYRRAMRDQVTVAFELYYEPIARWLFIRVYPSALGLSVYFLDIHERKQQEQRLTQLSAQLAEQTQMFDTTLSHIDDFAYVFDLQGRFVFINRALLDLWGLKLEQAVGKNFHELNYPTDLATRLQQEIAQVISTKARIANVTPYTSPTGKEGYYEYIFRPVFGLDGEVRLVAGSTRDITVHKRTERALRDSEERFRNLADNIGQFAWIAEPDGTFIWFNRRWTEYTGLTLEQMNTPAASIVQHPDHASRVAAKFKQHVRDGLDWEDVFPLRGRNGEYRWFLSRAFPIRDDRGAILSWFGTNTDITDLRAAREAAERANHAKDDFLAALSHELRTPLNPVLLIATEAAANPDLPPAVRSDFEAIARNVTLEAQLIDDLLDLTRITHGKVALNLQPIDLHTVIRDAVETVSAEIDAKHIQLELELTERAPVVLGDAVRLQQVFWNIIRNAVKFTPQGGRVCIRSTRAPGESSVTLEITDNGIGMTIDELGRLFNAFAQGDHAGTGGSHRFGGLGLGLAISRALIELHAGRIEARSDGPNCGSTFEVELPVIAGDSRPPFRVTTHSRSPHIESATAIRILLVEDHEPTRLTLKQLLLRRHYEVSAAGTVQEARALAQAGRFDLLVSDIGLPDGDGCALMEELRERYKLSGIALTGYGMEDDVDRCKRAGFTTHLIKPIRIQALDEALNQLAPTAAVLRLNAP